MMASRRSSETTSRRSSIRLPASGCLKREAGDLAARLGQTGDQPTTDRIDPDRKDNWDRRGRLAHGRHGAAHGDNNIDIGADEFGRDFGVALSAPLRPTIFDGDGPVLDPTEFA